MKREFSLIISILIILSCGGEENVSSVCFKCHSRDELGEGPITSASTPLQHMLENGDGIILRVSYDPLDTLSFSTGWVKRGYHSDEDLKDCSPCHRVDMEGVEHGGFYYPEASLERFYSSYCASACHNYLPYELKPETLISSCESTNSHRLIFENGFSEDRGDIKLFYIPSGCGGCHSVKEFRHGSIPDCLDCHKFVLGIKGDLHSIHIDLTGEQLCGYCHYTEEERLFRASCYNCHFSAHCP